MNILFSGVSPLSAPVSLTTITPTSVMELGASNIEGDVYLADSRPDKSLLASVAGVGATFYSSAAMALDQAAPSSGTGHPLLWGMLWGGLAVVVGLPTVLVLGNFISTLQQRRGEWLKEKLRPGGFYSGGFYIQPPPTPEELKIEEEKRLARMTPPLLVRELPTEWRDILLGLGANPEDVVRDKFGRATFPKSLPSYIPASKVSGVESRANVVRLPKGDESGLFICKTGGAEMYDMGNLMWVDHFILFDERSRTAIDVTADVKQAPLLSRMLPGELVNEEGTEFWRQLVNGFVPRDWIPPSLYGMGTFEDLPGAKAPKGPAIVAMEVSGERFEEMRAVMVRLKIARQTLDREIEALRDAAKSSGMAEALTPKQLPSGE